MFYILIYLITQLICSVRSACRADVETIIGGYESTHAIYGVTFDIDKRTNDMVVAGSMYKGSHNMGYITYIDDSLCKIRWQLQDGVLD